MIALGFIPGRPAPARAGRGFRRVQILNHVPRYSADERVQAHKAVQRERISLRLLILSTQREAYLERLKPSKDLQAALEAGAPPLEERSNEELAALDLAADQKMIALSLASSEERRAFDRAVLQAAERELRLLPRLAKAASAWPSRLRIDDPEMLEGLLIESLEAACAGWRPELGAFGTYAGQRAYALIRKYYTRALLSPPDHINLLADKSPRVDPILRERIAEVWDSLSDSEQDLLECYLERECGLEELAEARGLSLSRLIYRIRKIRGKFAELRALAA